MHIVFLKQIITPDIVANVVTGMNNHGMVTNSAISLVLTRPRNSYFCPTAR